MDQVNVEDVLTILRPIWNEKMETAHRVRGRIENVLNAAKVRGLRTGENPATWRGNLEYLLRGHPKGPKRHHPAMPFTDLPAFMKMLSGAKGMGARALELLIHTAARTSEVLEAKWDEFDFDNAVWTVPAERMKAAKTHRVPLSPQAVETLRSLPRVTDYVFPGKKRDKPPSNMIMAAVLRRMDLAHYTVHGFRSSFRDWCSEGAKAPREIAEQALAHQVGNEVERAYRRGDVLEQRRQLMEEWSDYLVT